MIIGNGAGDVAECNADFTLRERQWVRLSASYDHESGRARITAVPAAASAAQRLVSPPRTFEAQLAPVCAPSTPRPFVLAAWREGDDERGPQYTAHFDGKLEAPRLSRGELPPDALALLCDISPPESLRDRVVGWWDFALEVEGRHIVDRSDNRLQGQLENLPTRAVTGLDWDGSEHDWRHAPASYAAIHFHSDDVYDAGWDDAFTLDVPDDWKSGIYAARLRSDDGVDHIPFFVAPPRGTARAKLAFLVPTATYLAYANMPAPHAIVRELVRSSETGPRPLPAAAVRDRSRAVGSVLLPHPSRWERRPPLVSSSPRPQSETPSGPLGLQRRHVDQRLARSQRPGLRRHHR